MKNPWEIIPLVDYENHMSYEGVEQLQTLNRIMEKQLKTKDISSAMILGIAGGNGLNHVIDSIDIIYGNDINEKYLEQCKARYQNLKDRLVLLQKDLSKQQKGLPYADLVIANLFVEYIGYDMFSKHIEKISPKYISVVLQKEGSVKKLVSDTPYAHNLEQANTVYTKITDEDIINALQKISFQVDKEEIYTLPNGKEFVVLDFRKSSLKNKH